MVLGSSRGARGGELSYLFVVTYGRSGSTLLMGVLNSIPGYLLRGENWDALHHLFAFHRTLAEGSRRWAVERTRRPTHPFYGIGDFPAETSVAGIRQLALDTVLRPEPGTRVTGFKEIRWHRDDLEEYVAWLRLVFPGARFVVGTRNLQDVARSGWWARNPDASADLPVIEARLLALADSLGEAAFRVHHDDHVADPDALRGLFTWLGEPFDEPTVRRVLGVRHSV